MKVDANTGICPPALIFTIGREQLGLRESGTRMDVPKCPMIYIPYGRVGPSHNKVAGVSDGLPASNGIGLRTTVLSRHGVQVDEGISCSRPQCRMKPTVLVPEPADLSGAIHAEDFTP